MARGKATKLTEAQEEALKKEITIAQKYEILQALLHPRMAHVDTIYITEDGKYYFSKGHKMVSTKQLDPDKPEDAKKILLTGKKYSTEELEGTYINKKKVVDEIAKDDFLLDGEDIIKEYNAFLKEEREKKQKQMVDNPDATAELLAKMFKKNAAEKAE